MAHASITFLVILVITLSFVENAPSNNKKAKNDDSVTRLVFVDEIDSSTINNNPQVMRSTPPTLVQKSVISRSIQSRPVLGQNDPPLQNNFPFRPTGLPRMDDERQNWGFIVEDEDLPEDESYYNRPIALPKIINTDILKVQKSKKFAKTPTKASEIAKPSDCDAAILTCCTNMSKSCFEFNGCMSISKDMIQEVCSKANIDRVIADYATYYKMPTTK